MGFLETIAKLPQEVGRKNKFKLDSVHMTTNNFFWLKPVFSREVVAKEDININMSLFSRLSPLSKPAYADVSFVNRAFFVPYRTVWPWFNDFYEGTKNVNNVTVDAVPTVSNYDLIKAFSQFCTTSGSGDYDVSIRVDRYEDVVNGEDGAGGTELVVIESFNGYFTPLGKRLYDTLLSLGYNFPLHYEEHDGGDVDASYETGVHQYSALPLLSMLKVWNDWFRLTNYDEVVEVLGTSYTPEYFFTQSTWASKTYLDYADVRAILSFLCRIPYERDYFNMSSRRPFANQDAIGINISDPTTDTRVIANDSSDFVPQIQRASGAAITKLSQFALTALHRINDFFVRNRIVGNRTLDKYFAMFGIKLSDEALRRSVYLGQYIQRIDIADVMSNAGTSDTLLGDYAGKGISSPRGSLNVKYSANEFGQLIVVSQVIPKVSYYQGVRREMQHIGRFDFFNGKFDCLGVQAISRSEIDATAQGADEIAGYIPRYAEYKQSTTQDMLTGDFRVARAGAVGLEYFQLFRKLTSLSYGGNDVVINKRFCLAYHDNPDYAADAAQYNRIFAAASDFYDHFITYYNFNVVSFKPMEPLFESFDLHDEDGHEQTTVSVGGHRF